MTDTDTFFYTWLEQLKKIAQLNEEIETLQSQTEKADGLWEKDSIDKKTAEQAEEELKVKKEEISKIQNAANDNKSHLLNMVRAAKDQSVIINPKQSASGLTPNSYHLYLKGNDDLEYVTM